MALKQVAPGLRQISLGIVNAYLLDDGKELTLIDTGVPGSEKTILADIAALGKRPDDVKQILLTHVHGDHTGALAALKEATGAPAYMHHDDAELIRRGVVMRPVTAAPGLINGLLTKMMMGRAPMPVTPAEIEHEVADDDILPFAGGLRAVAAPGHCLGQLTFLWPQHGGVLIAGDAASRQFGGLGYPPIFEDFPTGLRSLERLGERQFEVAVFGHGGPLMGRASEQFRKKWPPRS